MLSLSARLYPIILRLPPAEGKASGKNNKGNCSKMTLCLGQWVEWKRKRNAVVRQPRCEEVEEKHEMSRKRNDGSWERAGNQGPKEAPKQWR